MNELFGVSMSVIATVAVALTAIILLILAWLAWRNPVMFKVGLRNIPRRPAQTTLIVLGLMLSTLIMSAAFTTGDTLTNSIDAEVIDLLGPVDELIAYDNEEAPASESQQVIPADLAEEWRAAAADSDAIAGFLPMRAESVSIRNSDTGLKEPFANAVSYDLAAAEPFGGLRDTSGNALSALAENEIAVNTELAEQLGAEPGHVLQVFIGGQPTELTVAAIVPTTFLGGTSGDPLNREGAVLNDAFFTSALQREGIYDAIAITNDGSDRGGADLSEEVVTLFEGDTDDDTVGGGVFGDAPFNVVEVKVESLEAAQLVGNIFTSIFVVFGLFSIAAGILLIFLIFVMIAAERKPEMGMARAVGARRRHLIESFLAEGMAYDLGSAVVGALGGIGVAYLMVSFVEYIAGDQLGVDLQLAVSPRSFIVAFCIGVIATFTVITIASFRASRLNIVAAIRDLPESQTINPERATLRGYLRGTMNGFVAFGVLLTSLILAMRFPSAAPLFLLAAFVGAVGPWLYVLRNHNFGLPADERKIGGAFPGFPVWPIITLPLVPIFLAYLVALPIVRFTRDRRIANPPVLLVAVGVLVAPVGMALAAMQRHKQPIAWSVGFSSVAGFLGAILLQWGLDANSMFLFLSGVSLLVLWVVVTLRYFGVQERLAFTVGSGFLLAIWYLPGAVFEALFGELDGNFEMFFLSGVVMVSSATFIIVYNADLLLPALARFGSRLGRFYPAVKTAIAYPLTARFRTGMTIAMIGLISFALMMFATVNENFANIFINDEAAGGFDITVPINSTNRLDDLHAALEAEGVDTSPITGVAENRLAFAGTTELRDPDHLDDDGNPDPEFRTFTVVGGDQAFFDLNEMAIKTRAAGFEDDRAVWDAVASTDGYAVLPAIMLAEPDPFAEPTGIEPLRIDRDLEAGFEPFTIEMRTPGSAEVTEITVIGIAKDSLGTFWNAVIVNEPSFTTTFPDATNQTFYVQVEGVDAEEYARTIEASLIQASADSLLGLLDEFSRQQTGFLFLFQGFMGLGLLVGIAALGVIAFRAVVERRQQIGMLRAIGYRRSMVSLSFVLESSFVALSGILMGLVLGVSLAWVLFTSGDIDDSATDVAFVVPWLQLTVISAIAFFSSILMTIIPARSASRVEIADALRYE